jgi:hypothetical protein
MGHTQAPVPENTQYLKYKKNWACITAGLAFVLTNNKLNQMEKRKMTESLIFDKGAD